MFTGTVNTGWPCCQVSTDGSGKVTCASVEPMVLIWLLTLTHILLISMQYGGQTMLLIVCLLIIGSLAYRFIDGRTAKNILLLLGVLLIASYSLFLVSCSHFNDAITTTIKP